jgi:ribosomal protein S18 acetylase RimI-like enzyme
MIHTIKLLTDSEEVHRLYEFIKKYPLEYPDYFIWLEKCKRQMELGEKKAYYATINKEIIGNIIFQILKEDNSVFEIKNFRVSENHRHCGVGSALETMLYSYAKSNGFNKIQVDTHQDNVDMIQFLIKHGYIIESQENLYKRNKPEIILSKKL